MSSQLVSLVWDGHHTTLVSVFEKLLVNSHIVDCTLAAEGQKMKAHKEVLCAFSPFFELLFREETEMNPTVIISGIGFRDLRSLVDFMYQGKLEVTEERIQDLIDAAECLQIKGLGGGHKENGSGNISNTKALAKRPAFSSDVSHMLTRKCQREESASIGSKESEVNDLIDSNEIRPKISVVMCGAMQASRVQNLMPNSDAQNLSIVSNTPLIPVHSTLSEIEMGSSHLQGEYVVTKKPDSFGDENINGSKRQRSRRMRTCGSSGEYAIENVYECGEESILGLSADISVPSVKNVYENLPLDCIHSAVPSSHLCNRVGFSVKSELSNIYTNSSSEPVDPIVSTVDTQDPLFHSEFHVKSEDEILLSVDKDLISGHDEISENNPKNIRFSSLSEMQKEVVCMERNNESSGAASSGILESTSPQEFPTAFVKVQRLRRKETAVKLMPGLPAEVNPHDVSTHLSHPTTVCDEELSGPIGRVASNSTVKQYRCHICGKNFTRNWAMKQHQRIHSGMKPYKCTECDYTTAHRSNLKTHQRIHSGVKPYKCTECDYTTADNSHLRTHQRIHSGLKPYKCTECDYSAVLSGQLTRHRRIHSGEKPFKCSECDYRASESTNLKIHLQVHRGVKPYKCSECNYACRRKYHLKRHLQRTHSIKKP